jgi:hypothetical protein
MILDLDQYLLEGSLSGRRVLPQRAMSQQQAVDCLADAGFESIMERE